MAGKFARMVPTERSAIKATFTVSTLVEPNRRCRGLPG